MLRKRFLLAPLMLLAALMALVLPGCQASPEDSIRTNLDAELSAITNNQDEMLGELSESDLEAMAQFGVDGKELIAEWLVGFDYEIGDVTLASDEESAVAAVTVTCKPMATVMADWLTQIQEAVYSGAYATEDEFYAGAGELLTSLMESAEPAEFAGTVDYEKNSDGDWEATDESIDALWQTLLS